MDPERQPLLAPINELKRRRFRPLTAEEVHATRQNVTWRRIRFLVKFLFWGIIAMFLSIVACMLMKTPGCNRDFPSVPPVHLTFAPLINSGRIGDDDDGPDGIFMS